MSRIAVHFFDQGFHRVIFDAMPIPVLVVDRNLRVLEYNEAAAQLFGSDQPAISNRAGGEVWQCIHATGSSQGCGHGPTCRTCVIRDSIEAAARGRRVIRKKTGLDLIRNGRPTRIDLRVSCQPFTYEKNNLVLLVLEGLNDPA